MFPDTIQTLELFLKNFRTLINAEFANLKLKISELSVICAHFLKGQLVYSPELGNEPQWCSVTVTGGANYMVCGRSSRDCHFEACFLLD